MQKILCPVDFSRCSEAGLIQASRLAKASSALLYLLHVSEVSPAYADGLGGFADYDEDVRMDAERLKAIFPPDAGVEFEHHHRVGSPSTEIVRFAKRYGVDMIVMGTHGRSGFSRLLMGSIAESVVRNASVPVLTLHDPGCHEGEPEARGKHREDESHRLAKIAW